jgi:hypothetical protein
VARSVGTFLGATLRVVAGAARGARTGAQKTREKVVRARAATPTPSARPAPHRPRPPEPGTGYPGDHRGAVTARYAPHLDGEPDPGEIVWTWVPFEEDHSRGKDRPVLLVGRDGPWLLGLMLSSRDHDTRPGAPDEHWLDLGTGEWDTRHRPSEVRLDRVIRIDPDAVRREGAVLDRTRFQMVASSLSGARD